MNNCINSAINNTINNTILVCNNLCNYCRDYCVNNNVCYCDCVDNKINYNKLCVNNSAFDYKLLIFIILCVICFIFITSCARVWLANREIRNEMRYNEPYVSLLDYVSDVSDVSITVRNPQLHNDSISVLNNSTDIDDSDDLPQYELLEYNELLPEYCIVSNVNISCTSCV